MVLQGQYVPSTRDWVRNQVEAYERSAGREANTLRDTGLPIIIVTMRGAKSGNVRKIGLMRVEHNGQYALIGSKGGAPKNPGWVANLRAHPSARTPQPDCAPSPACSARTHPVRPWGGSTVVSPRRTRGPSATGGRDRLQERKNFPLGCVAAGFQKFRLGPGRRLTDGCDAGFILPTWHR